MYSVEIGLPMAVERKGKDSVSAGNHDNGMVHSIRETTRSTKEVVVALFQEKN